jgi:hypothetical protein
MFVSADCRYSGAWLVSSAFMIFAFGSEILHGLTLAAGAPQADEISLMKVE